MILYIVGPTASGKSALALELAERLGAEIVNADSRQVYRGLDVGTAKPPPADRSRVRHHLLDAAEPGAIMDAARFVAMADAALADIAARGRRALVVGGTGLWIRALQRGLFAAPRKDPALRRALELTERALGPGVLHARLRAVDPRAAARIEPGDPVRIVRALEVFLQTGEPLSAHHERHARGAPRHAALTLGLDVPPAELRARIEKRTPAMFAGGLLDEARMLAERGLADWGGKLIGYQEALEVIAGRAELAAAIERTVVRTRQYAKRQRTWFAREDVRWLGAPIDVDRLAREIG